MSMMARATSITSGVSSLSNQKMPFAYANGIFLNSNQQHFQQKSQYEFCKSSENESYRVISRGAENFSVDDLHVVDSWRLASTSCADRALLDERACEINFSKPAKLL